VGIVGVADQDRTERRRAVPLAKQVPADDELLLEAVLDLDPRRGSSAGEVDRIDPLGDHAFEAVALGRGQHRVGIVARRRDRER